MTLLLPMVWGVLALVTPSSNSIEIAADSAFGIAAEVQPLPPKGALEEGMRGEIAHLYNTGILAVRNGQYRRALAAVREARVLGFRALKQGPTPHLLAKRHFTRVLYTEEQLIEITLIDEQLEHPPERIDQRSILLQRRAFLLHNLFLAVRSFLGLSDARLLKESVHAYEVAIEEADTLKQSLILGYAALLAERGSFREARRAFAKLSEHDREQEGMDVAVAYYYLALGDKRRAIGKLIEAARRDNWRHGHPGREEHTFRAQVYRMNDFDLLRDHPRFSELVTQPEEQ